MRVRSIPFIAGMTVALLALAPAGAVAKPGDPDPSFGIDPFNLGALGSGAFASGLQGFADVELTPSGKILLAGETEVAGSGDYAIGRLRANGSFDTSFGDAVNHVATDNISGDDEINDIAVTGNGSIFVAAESDNNVASKFGVAKLDPGGFLDNGFSGDGRQTTAIGTSAVARAVQIRDGKVVAAGGAVVAGVSQTAVVRYLPGGAPDPAFGGGDGIVTLALGQTSTAFDLALQRDGKIVVAGARATAANSSRIMVARFRANGTLDPTFGSGGVATLQAGPASFAFAVVLDRRRRIVIAGASEGGTPSGFVARITTAGKRDRSFGGGDGVARSLFGLGFSFLTDIAVQRNGKVVVVGFGGDIPGLVGGTLVGRFTADGRIDKRFADRGSRLFLLGGSDFALVATALQRNGKIIVGAPFSPDADVEALIAARFRGDRRRR